MHFQAVGNIITDLHVGKEAVILIYKAQPAAAGRNIHHVNAVILYGTAGAGEHTPDGFQKHGLPGPCTSKYSKDFPFFNGKGQGF